MTEKNDNNDLLAFDRYDILKVIIVLSCISFGFGVVPNMLTKANSFVNISGWVLIFVIFFVGKFSLKSVDEIKNKKGEIN